MMVKTDTSVFNLVVETSQEFLGPVAERFMRRQITTHLKKEPEELRQTDIPKLVDWTRLAFAMLTSNEEQIERFCENLLAISPIDSPITKVNYDKNT